MQLIGFILTGLVTGVFSGVLGIGGGVVLIQILVLVFGFTQLAANGTSLVALLLPVGALGAWEYYKAGKISLDHVRFGLLIACGILVGTYLGAKLAVHLPEDTVRKVFAVFLFFLSIKMFIR